MTEIAQQNIFMARVAEQTKLFEDCVFFISKVMQETGSERCIEVREILSIAFKNLIAQKRDACNQIKAILASDKYSKYYECLHVYKETIELELFSDCN